MLTDVWRVWTAIELLSAEVQIRDERFASSPNFWKPR